MVKETKKFGWERRVWSTCFAHFWSVPEGDVGCLLALTGQYKPPTGFCISLMRLPGNRRTGLLTCFTQSISFITQAHRRVSKVQRKMCSLREQRTRAPSILTMSWRITDKPPRWKVVAESRKDAAVLGLRRRIQSGARDEAGSLRAFVK